MEKYIRISFSFLSLLLVANIATAQSLEIRDSIPVPVKKKRPAPIKSEYSIGLRLNTDGWSVFYDRGKIKSPDKTTDYFYSMNFWQIELSEKRHPQQIKRTNTIGSSTDNAKPFAYGKINNFYSLKFGFGKRKLFAGKPELNNDVEQGTVSIHYTYMGGLSLGLEKPYYLDAYVPSGGGGAELQTIKYSDTTSDQFLNQAGIAGSSGFGKGIGETKIVPGVHGKAGLHFDFAATKKSKLAIETGVAVEIYMRGIELMASSKAKPYFVNAYASFQFGKRWAQKK